ncbi:prenyltransferase [Tardisphaera miroshnichenkoae]
MDNEALRLIRKAKTVKIEDPSGRWSENARYALEGGIVVAIDPSHAQAPRTVNFEIRDKGLTLSGHGKLLVLGDPALNDLERGKLVYRAPEVLPLLMRGWLLAKIVPEGLTIERDGTRKDENIRPDDLNTSTTLKYLKALKPWTFQQTFASAVIAALLAPAINPFLLVLSLALLLIAHSSFNMMNDYFDYSSSLDKPKNMGSMGSRVLVDKLIPLRAFRLYMISLLGVALAGGAYLLYVRPAIWPYFIIGLVAGSFYSVPKVGWRWIALGDLAIFLTWGPGIFLGSYVLQGGSVNVPTILIAVALGMLVLAIAHINNWRDMLDERAAGIVSVASLLGDKASLIYYLVMIWGSYALFACAVLIDPKLFPILGSLLTVPWAVRLTRATRDPEDPIRSKLDMETAKFTALHMYFTVGFVLLFRLFPYFVSLR